MKLSEYKKEYQDFSAQASNVARTIAFSGIALIWIFRIESDLGPVLPDSLLLPTALLALALALDLLHYFLGALIWCAFYRIHENRLTDETEDPNLTHHTIFVFPIYLFFGAKLISVAAAYFFLGRFLLSKLFTG